MPGWTPGLRRPRTGRTARPTAAGQRLAAHARDVVAGLEAAEADLAGLGTTVTGVLRVATIPTLGRALLPHVLTLLASTAPEVDVLIEQLEPEHSLPALARGELDLVLAGEYGLTPRRLPTTLERVDLGNEPVYVLVPADHPSPARTSTFRTCVRTGG